jgi:hypothetical protein
MLRQHFRDLHPFDKVVVLTERYFPWCERCAMQVNPVYPRHIQTQECQTGVERKLQRESAVRLALALRRQFSVHGDVLECVEVFEYLGHLLAQDDDDAQAIQQQLQKARGVWARVGQVLCGENTASRIAAKFYKAVVQAILLLEARRGISPTQPWQGSRGFTYAWRTRWQGSIDRRGVPMEFGSIRR